MATGTIPQPAVPLDFVIETKNWDNISVSSQSYSESTVSISKTGYTPIGLVGWEIANASSSGTNRTKCFLFRYYISGNTLYYSIGNYSTSSAKVRLYAQILYKKD